MEAQQKKRLLLLAFVAVFAVLILCAFLRAKGTF
jgi:hypothetical protein